MLSCYSVFPLNQGRIRSGFAMTEPAVASSDATNICLQMYDPFIAVFPCYVTHLCMQITSTHVVLNGVKWWTTNALHPRCEILIVMGKTNASHPSPHKQQSMVLVPMDTPGVTITRALSFCGHSGAAANSSPLSFFYDLICIPFHRGKPGWSRRNKVYICGTP
jgi:acyl-CoA dehydrogenase